jgi:peptidoglycan/xylan/chitin deacetylase (PgdA/CDA1 family)
MSEPCPILVFHQTSHRFYPGVNNIRPHRFFQIIDLIETWGFSFTSVDELDSAGADRPVVALTFDDGYRDNFEILEYLSGQGITPAVFIPTDFIGGRNRWEYSSTFFPSRHLDESQLRRLAGMGVIIGSHGASHRSLIGGDDESIRRELTGSRERLEEITGRAVELISFPYGKVSRRIIEISRECGYRRGFTLERRVGGGEEADGFVLPRTPIYASDDYFSLRGRLLKRSRRERFKDRIINMLSSGSIIVRRRLK